MNAPVNGMGSFLKRAFGFGAPLPFAARAAVDASFGGATGYLFASPEHKTRDTLMGAGIGVIGTFAMDHFSGVRMPSNKPIVGVAEAVAEHTESAVSAEQLHNQGVVDRGRAQWEAFCARGKELVEKQGGLHG